MANGEYVPLIMTLLDTVNFVNFKGPPKGRPSYVRELREEIRLCHEYPRYLTAREATLRKYLSILSTEEMGAFKGKQD